MRSVTYDEFVVAWQTYWGRREIGFVIDNAMANQVAASEKTLRAFYAQWVAALEVFPVESSIWLLGTPDLTPELLPTRRPRDVGPPPVARVGPFVTGNPSTFGVSQHAGDYVIPLPKNSEAARFGRRAARGKPGLIISLIALATAWIPYFALPLALLGLAWTSVAHWNLHRHFRRGGLPLLWRVRGPLIAGQVAAVLSIVLAVTIAVPRFLPTTPDLKEQFAMSHSYEGSLTGGIIDRLRQHWPEADVTAEFDNGDPDSPTFIRVRVATDVYLDAVPGEVGWTARPMAVVGGKIIPVENNPAYGFGVTANDPAELIADRFYEEVRFWWAQLHPDDVENEQSA